MKLPQLPQQDTPAKISSVLQTILFLVMFIGIYLLFRQVVHSLLLRILVLLADYFVSAMILYLAIRPLMQKLESKLRGRE